VRDVTAALDLLPEQRYPFPRFDVAIANLPLLRPRIEEIAASAAVQPLSALQLLSPVGNPGKIIGAPVNYRKHFEEALADPEIHHQTHRNDIHRAGLFLKATSSVVGAGEGVVIRHPDRRTDHEVELAVIIGRRTVRASRASAMSNVAGYCIALDMTLRGPEERSFRKSIDTYTVLGPCLVTAEELQTPGDLELSLTVNGEARQRANTRDLIVDVPGLIELASSFYTLEAGDVLLTGTPAGVGPVHEGDVMHAEIEGIGSIDVRVRAAH
jgi:2-keto-4-pentenoate hydratase/2-oxohepta-3-ene-1,7-dioic acid hydratase in catechol pathway